MPRKIKRMDIREFSRNGYLLEANRRFFNPLGIALEVVTGKGGVEKLGGIWDYREDKEGIHLGLSELCREELTDAVECRDFIDSEIASRKDERMKLFKSTSEIEPLIDPDDPPYRPSLGG